MSDDTRSRLFAKIEAWWRAHRKAWTDNRSTSGVEDMEEDKDMVLIGRYRIEWTEEAPPDELLGDDWLFEQLPDIDEDNDDVTMSSHHVAIARRLEAFE